MSDINSISLFLDEALVDELWTLAKRDGLMIEKVKEISAKLDAKAKFGLGKLWKWMTADIEAELSAEGATSSSQKLQFTSVFRSMILPDIISDIIRVGKDNDNILRLKQEQGSFVEIETDTLELTPLPTFAGFMRQMMIFSLAEDRDQKQELNFDSTISMAEKFTSTERALTFYIRAENKDDGSSLLYQLYNQEGGSEELLNALCMSNNDHVLALSKLSTQHGDAIIFCVLEERYLKRNLAVFGVERPIRIFGRAAFFKAAGNHIFLGIQPISIALA